MRRLLLASGRAGVAPAWSSADESRPDVAPEAVGPLWLEISPSPLGFPAAASRMTAHPDGDWPLPRMRGLEHVGGTFYLQIVDDEGRELSRCRFTKT